MLSFHPTVTADGDELLTHWAKNGKNAVCTITPQREREGQVHLGRTCQKSASFAVGWKFCMLSCRCRRKMGCFRETWM